MVFGDVRDCNTYKQRVLHDENFIHKFLTILFDERGRAAWGGGPSPRWRFPWGGTPPDGRGASARFAGVTGFLGTKPVPCLPLEVSLV